MLFWQATAKEDLEFLTGRQRQVATLRKAGHSNAEVARTLGLAEGTIRTHLHQAKARLTAWPRSVQEGAEIGTLKGGIGCHGRRFRPWFQSKNHPVSVNNRG
ncbi:MAG: response regulator transcription factor [Bacillota bacterium]